MFRNTREKHVIQNRANNWILVVTWEKTAFCSKQGFYCSYFKIVSFERRSYFYDWNIIILSLKNTIIRTAFFTTHGNEVNGTNLYFPNCSSYIKKRHQILRLPYFLLLKKEQQRLVISVFITVSSWIQELWDGLFGCSALFIWKPRTNHSSRQEQIIESNNVLLDIHHALALLLVP